jgi:hypothetical protein
MTQILEFARRAARLRAPLFVGLATVFSACNATDKLTNPSDTPADIPAGTTVADAPSFATSFRGGIPMGTFALPTSLFGTAYNGAMRNIWPSLLVQELNAIRARGGKVVLMFAGNERHYKDGSHHFSFTMWKNRVSRFKGVNFSQFVQDGTIIGHYLIDEPNDPHNWGGRPVPGSMVEQMAQYSKQLWPSMATVVRAEPGYLVKTGGGYRYLDAAWAQYVTWKGTPGDYIKRNVADAQRAGVALVTGLNISKGGPNKGRMSASLIKSAGGTLLGSSYPCAFISWQYDGGYYTTASVMDAMRYLRSKAQNRSMKSCRG